MKIYYLLPFVFLITACSSTSRVIRAETNQAAALSKVTLADKKHAKAEKAKDSQIANLTQEVKILLSTPPSSDAVSAANQLLGSTLELTGAPDKKESDLENEVQQLLADKAKNQVQMSKIEAKNNSIKKDLDSANKDKEKANQQLSKTTTTLYQTALTVAADNDTKSTIFHIMLGTVIFIVLMICLRLFFKFTATGAAIAAKIP